MSSASLSRVAYYLALIGGILMVIFGLLSFFEFSFGRFLLHWGITYGGIITLVGGIIAIIGARSASTLVWAIVLIIVGFIGDGLGGLLVVLGGVFGLIAVAVKKA